MQMCEFDVMSGPRNKLGTTGQVFDLLREQRDVSFDIAGMNLVSASQPFFPRLVDQHLANRPDEDDKKVVDCRTHLRQQRRRAKGFGHGVPVRATGFLSTVLKSGGEARRQRQARPDMHAPCATRTMRPGEHGKYCMALLQDSRALRAEAPVISYREWSDAPVCNCARNGRNSPEKPVFERLQTRPGV